ncbi:MAG TPA: polysaccharide deacetylase family protein [Tepidisphaeraceae bacterium]|jgi:peptidoglycan/xylan/chitin deacetylase (PgdA/CDA1 family)|nr:polysaccharide deacetylase family protein [Tepidisphaeraceae bacterium]
MINVAQTLIRNTDSVFARAYLGVRPERPALMSFLFHSLFRDEREIAMNHVDPLQRTTVAQFRQFIEYYLEHGYTFIDPQDVLNGLKADRKYALITFDDGYFNNALALPILNEFRVPATFFISANHVRDNKCFWWDVLHRERCQRGASPQQIYREGAAMKSMTTEAMEVQLTRHFGTDAFRPRSDIDRPFTPSELRDFASNPYVHIGNHTANHGILTNYPPDQVREQVAGAQAMLTEMTGKTPISIAYPNGGHSLEVVRICREAGLKVGFTVRPEKSALPLGEPDSDLLRLGRFCPHGESSIIGQCRTYRSDVLVYGLFRDTYLRLVRGKVAQ